MTEGVLGRVVLADLLDRPAVALDARVHDDDTVERCTDLAHALQTDLDGHSCGVSSFLVWGEPAGPGGEHTDRSGSMDSCGAG